MGPEREACGVNAGIAHIPDDDWRELADEFDEQHATARELRHMMIHGRLDDEYPASGGTHSPSEVHTPPAMPAPSSESGGAGESSHADKRAA